MNSKAMPLNPARCFAIIDLSVHRRNLRVSWGLDPEPSPSDAKDGSLPLPDVIVVHEDAKGMVFVEGATRHGEWSGDDWHSSVEEALRSSVERYGEAMGPWREIPEDVLDPLEFAVEAWKREHGSSA